jgi:hypothetical protein
MDQSAKLSISDPFVRWLLRASFPEYKGRKISARLYVRPLSLDLNWDGGSRDSVIFLDPVSGAASALRVPSPFDRAAHEPVVLPPGRILAVHSIFCGRDTGVTLYVWPGSPEAGKFGI